VAVAGPTLGRFGSRVLHIPVAGLESVAAAVGAATAGIGDPPDPRPFHGHLTLARSRGRGRAVVDLAPLARQPFAATWPVSELTVVSSVPGRGGSRYEIVARQPLS